MQEQRRAGWESCQLLQQDYNFRLCCLLGEGWHVGKSTCMPLRQPLGHLAYGTGHDTSFEYTVLWHVDMWASAVG